MKNFSINCQNSHKGSEERKVTYYFISSCSRYACDLCITLNWFLCKIMLYFDLSGWFDSFTFKRWFVDLFLPSVVNKDGPIFLFGDNLGSHFSTDLVKLAKEFTLLYYQQMQLIGSKYLMCQYLVQ